MKIKYFLLICVLVTITGCGTLRHIKYPYMHSYSYIPSKNYGFDRADPKSFTVYPFKNLTWDKTAAIRAQRETAMAFSLIGEVRSLKDTAKVAELPFTYKNALKTAREQDSDAVIIGSVNKQDSIFLFLLSYNYVQMQISIYETKSGNLLWTGQGQGFVSALASSVYWIPIPINSTIQHLYWSQIVNDLYHRVAISMVNRIKPSVTKLEK